MKYKKVLYYQLYKFLRLHYELKIESLAGVGSVTVISEIG